MLLTIILIPMCQSCVVCFRISRIHEVVSFNELIPARQIITLRSVDTLIALNSKDLGFSLVYSMAGS